MGDNVVVRIDEASRRVGSRARRGTKGLYLTSSDSASSALAMVNMALGRASLENDVRGGEKVLQDVLTQARWLGSHLNAERCSLRDAFDAAIALRETFAETCAPTLARLRQLPGKSQNHDPLDEMVYAVLDGFHSTQRKELEQMVIRDGLTHLYNRRYFDQRVEEEWRRASRYDQTLVLLLMDVDGLKQVNDRHGHVAGDNLIKRASSTMLAEARAIDVVARYGGDEFAIIMPQTVAVGGVALARRIWQRFTAEKTGRARSAVGISAGVAEYPTDGATVEELVDAADQALYHSKESGRDRVTAFREALK